MRRALLGGHVGHVRSLIASDSLARRQRCFFVDQAYTEVTYCNITIYFIASMSPQPPPIALDDAASKFRV